MYFVSSGGGAAMRFLDQARRIQVIALVAACALAIAATLAPAVWAGGPEAEGASAKVIEVKGKVEIGAPGETARDAEPGDFIGAGEEVKVHGASAVTLALADNTLREFAGPTTLVIREDGAEGGTVLGDLTAAVANMLFSSNERPAGAVMATRAVTADASVSVPVLVRPAPGENLMEMPRKLEWKAIQGVPLYRVSVYSSSQMMWQGTTSEAGARWPAKDCTFEPGNTYYWVVEALVGNSTLRSHAADFTLLAGEESKSLSAALDEAGASVADAASSLALKVRICMDARAYSRAVDILYESIREAPTRNAYLLRAEVYGEMGLAEEAARDYREAMALPAVE
jgi:hypothetical protein